ncbi:MAG TPA: hypothetical protein VMS56_15955, partial [Thermoanaerobaculia bacterium]|nr:hypothetical protein [Thermoanaerobaculia bacterium]
FPVASFPLKTALAWLIFHGLDISAVLVLSGIALSLWRRMRDRGAQAVQSFGNDFFPLVLLFAISVTGLALTVSTMWLRGSFYGFLSILHAITVITALLYLPFGKFFHIFQRPAQLGVAFYKDVAAAEGMEPCARCGAEFAPRLQVEDLIRVERELGYRYETGRSGVDHYQRICPACRRTLLALAQGAIWAGAGPAGPSDAADVTPIRVE